MRRDWVDTCNYTEGPVSLWCLQLLMVPTWESPLKTLLLTPWPLLLPLSSSPKPCSRPKNLWAVLFLDLLLPPLLYYRLSLLYWDPIFLKEQLLIDDGCVLFQGLVTIKDVSLCFSQEEWRSLDPSQTDFYGEYVMQENCGIVVSLSKHDLPQPLSDCTLGEWSHLLWDCCIVSIWGSFLGRESVQVSTRERALGLIQRE